MFGYSPFFDDGRISRNNRKRRDIFGHNGMRCYNSPIADFDPGGDIRTVANPNIVANVCGCHMGSVSRWIVLVIVKGFGFIEVVPDFEQFGLKIESGASRRPSHGMVLATNLNIFADGAVTTNTCCKTIT